MKLFVFIVFLLLVYLYFRNFRNIYEHLSDDSRIDVDINEFKEVYLFAKDTTSQNVPKTMDSTKVNFLRFNSDYSGYKELLFILIDKYKHTDHNKNVHKYLTMDEIIAKLKYRKETN
jgi:hypothetical protein